MSTPEARTRLAERQAELMRALLTSEESAAGFDRESLAAAGHSLRRKRFQAVRRAWPALTAALGNAFETLFAGYAARVSLPAEGGPLADGRAFADFLARARRLPDAGCLEALFVDLNYTRSARGLVPRRSVTVQAVPLRQSRRLVVGCRLPVFGVRWFSLPLGGSATSTSRPNTPPGQTAE